MAAQPVIDITSSPAGTPSKIPPSSHRLPTISGLDALEDGGEAPPCYIHGAPERKKITEIWGAKGSGITAIALQASANALESGNAIVWVDCSTPVSRDRLSSLLEREQPSNSATATAADTHQNFRHLSAPTLSHLLALVLHPPPALFQDSTSLLIIDDLNALIDLDYPRAQAMGASRTDAQKWQAGRRYAVLGSLVSALNKLAALHNLAVIVTTGCAMRSRPDSGLGGAMAPGMGGAEWDSGVWNRIVAFRDFGGRFVGLQKAGGKNLISREGIGEPGRIIGFEIDPTSGAVSERMPGKPDGGAVVPAVAKLKSSPVKSRKRYFDEVADSDGEDEYGWDAGDEDVFAAGTMGNDASAVSATAAQREGAE